MKEKEAIKKAVDTIRFLSAEVISNANSGHSGIALGAAPLLYAAYASMKVDPAKPNWFNRDRFVMSAGHGSAPLYTTLHLFGYDVTIEDLKQFRKLGSRTPGHPEVGVTPGVDCSTGPLGQGIAMAVGLAFAEKKLAAMYNKTSGEEVIDHYTFCLVGDGCIMEGVSYEACNLAGLHKLNKLIVLYDKNDITLDGTRQAADGECVKARFEACGWNVIEVSDANDAEPILDAIAKAKASADKPTIIICQTVIGLGHKTAGSSKAHGAVLTAEECVELRKKFGAEGAALSIDKETRKYFETLVLKKSGAYKSWQATVDKYKMQYQEEHKNLNKFLNPSKQTFEVTPSGKTNYRAAGHIYLNQIAKQSPKLVGVNADVASSTQVFIAGGNDIACGVREFAMAAICNGLALHGFTPFCGTFLSFSDYCRSAIRSTALMNLPVTYIFTHDGLGHCPDGPTHQGNEHVSSLRLMPNMQVFRPCDDYEVLDTFKHVFENGRPACIILGRGDAPLVNSAKVDVTRGGYIIKSSGKPSAVLLSTGAEVSLCIEAAEILAKSGVQVNVVSIPSFKLFDTQSREYRDKVLCGDLPKIAVELGITDIWHKYVGPNGKIVGFNDFGHSAPNNVLMQKLGFTPESIARSVLDTINNK